MKRTLIHYGFAIFFIMSFLLFSCKKDDEKLVFPLSAEIFKSVSDKQVAFTSLTHSATSWNWDFGDGKTSTEKDPVHVYEQGGYYKAKLTASDSNGNSVSKEVSLAIALTPYALLTGDRTIEGYKGKTWRLTTNHTTNTDYLANADANFSNATSYKPLPNGIFSQLGLANVYKDEFTFFYDGTYVHNNTNSGGSSFAGLINQVVLNKGINITNQNGKEYGLGMAKFTPESGAKFTYVANEDFTIASAYGANNQLSYKGVSTLSFSGNEFIGFWDNQKKVIVNKITDSSMQLTMFMAASSKAFPANTNALILSFEVVK